MAWTTPRTWVAGETVTASIGNSAWRDNLSYLKDSPTFDGNVTITGTLTQTGVATLAAAPVLSALTASLPVFTNASKALASNAMTGTGSVVMSASPTLTGTIGAASMTLSGTLSVTGVATLTAAPVLSALTASLPVFTDGSKALTSNAMTGTGSVVMSTSPTLVTPALGTPSALILTNATGTPASIGLANGTGLPISGISGLGSGVGTWLATPSSANLATALTDETGTGSVVFSASPTLTGTIGAASMTLSGTLGVTGVATLTAAPVLSALTASLPVFTDGSKALTSNAMTGTGSVVMSASPTLTGTITAAAANFSGAVSTAGLSATTGAFSSTLTVSGFGTHAFSAGGAGANELNVRNTTAGTGNYARLTVSQDEGVTANLSAFSSTFTPSGASLAGGVLLEGARVGGLSLAASHASGDVRIYSRNTLAATWGASQALTLAGTLTPGGNIILGANYLSGDGGNEGITVSSTGAVTCSSTVAVTGNTTLTGTLTVNGGTASVVGAEAGTATLNIWADEGDDTLDQWAFTASDAGVFKLANASFGDVFQVNGSTGVGTYFDDWTVGGLLTLSGGTLLATSSGLTNGAGANTGTLTNSPVTGNPTKWIPINDSGVTRYIPAW